MKCNMGKLDRISRLVAGVALVLIGIAGGNNLQLLILGSVAAVTGAVGFCPIYVPFGFDTLDTVETAADGTPKAKKAA